MTPTDLSQSSDDTYLTKNLELADVDAKYHHARIAADIRAGILHMIIPKAIIKSAVDFRNVTKIAR